MLQNILDSINNILWSNALVILLLCSGIYYTIRIKFVQFTKIPLMFKFMFEKNDSGTGRTPFQAFALTLSTRVGTGNIAGVATAIAAGGPGAIFWMWLSAIFGAGTTIVETTLGQIYKETEGSEFRGGPQYFIDRGLGKRGLAILFAICSAVALGFCTPGVQANAIADSMNIAFGLPKMGVAIAIAILVAITIFGGVKRISQVTEYMGPFMAGAYLLLCLVIILVNISQVPALFALIFRSAFGKEAAFGAIIGKTVQWGIKRGIYSNEAGMGTASQASSTPYVSHPAKQGLVQSLSVYIDTLFVCTATALVILITNMYNVEGIKETLPGVQAGPGYVQYALDTLFKGYGSIFLALAMFFFAYSTILGNYYAAETGIAYVSKKLHAKNQKVILTLLRCATLVAILVFAPKESKLAWAIGDLGMGVLSWLNLTAILLLSGTAIRTINDFFKKYKEGEDAVFSPEELGIKNTEENVWSKQA